ARLTLIDANSNEVLRIDNPSTSLKQFESPLTPTKDRLIRLSGSNLKFMIPVFREQGQALSGALVADAEASELFADLAMAFEKVSAGTQRANVVVVDNSSRILYHTNHVLQGQFANQALPEFRAILEQAKANQSGTQTFRTPGSQEFVAAFGLVPSLNISVAVTRERSGLAGTAHTWGIAGLMFAAVVALAA